MELLTKAAFFQCCNCQLTKFQAAFMDYCRNLFYNRISQEMSAQGSQYE